MVISIDELRQSLPRTPEVEGLLLLIDLLQQQLQAASARIAELEQQVKELQQKLPPTSPPLAQPYSLDSERKRQAKRGPKKGQRRVIVRRGRLKTQDKIALAKRTEKIYPAGVSPEKCRYSHTRVLWRLEQGLAILVAYEIYRGPQRQYGEIPGAMGRCEFGMEIVTQIAFLVYSVGLSFDKVVVLLKFFQDLELTKSQVDRLLYRLAKQWEGEFETLCTLLSHSLVVHADETSWSIKSVWTMLAEKARVTLFGVPKDSETLAKLLDPATFEGLVISDHAAVYNHFDQMQKCWAHLIRKGIKLTLQAPESVDYRTFLDGLLTIYQEARRVQQDRRYSEEGRRRAAVRLQEELWELCPESELGDEAAQEKRTGLAHDYYLLVREVFGLSDQLFTFMTAAPAMQPNGETKPVDGTNNEAERSLRNPAMARQTGRTNKTLVGARRQTILVSVIDSLRVYLEEFTFRKVMDEIHHWQEKRGSCFSRLLQSLGLKVKTNHLHKIYPELAPTPTS